MNANKRAQLEALGFKIGTPQEFLKLTNDEIEQIELQLASNETTGITVCRDNPGGTGGQPAAGTSENGG